MFRHIMNCDSFFLEIYLDKYKKAEVPMLSWSVFFLVIALAAALLGFSSIAGTAAGIAKILFGVFLVLFLVSLFLGRRVI
jgi:uncharacterized membrane protein YtjA (UPF0391 family)